MSGWTIVTVRGKEASEYDYTHHDWEGDRSQATHDIVVSFDEDSRIRAWETYGHDHVYALLAAKRYDWERAEQLFDSYGELIDDAVVLGWNDTTDSGCARYYPRPDLGQWSHQFEENDPLKGERACSVMHAQHGINAKNPFHNRVGEWNDKHLENGNIKDDVIE